MKLPTINLSDKQIQQGADILSDIGIVVSAATILPSIFSEFNLYQLIIGIIISATLWILSIKIN